MADQNTPRLALPEWISKQASPWLVHNKSIRGLEGFSLRTSVLDRTHSAPPLTCSDGARYFIAAGATGLWAGFDGYLAVSYGTDASNGWVVINIEQEGMQVWIEAEQTQIEYINSAWQVSPERVSVLSALADIFVGSTLADGFQLYWDESNHFWYAAPPALIECSDLEGWMGASIDTAISPRRLFTLAAPQTLAFATSIAPDFDRGLNFTLTLTGNATLANPTHKKVGQSGTIEIKQDATGGRTLAYGTDWLFPGGQSVGGVISSAANSRDLIAYEVQSDGKITCVLSLDYSA